MQKEVIDKDDLTRWIYARYIDDVWNSWKYSPDSNFPILITAGASFQNNYGDLIPCEREIRLTYKEAMNLYFELQDALRKAIEHGYTQDPLEA